LRWPLLWRRSNHFERDWLASQTRYARGSFSRRAMHASGDSPCHASAKHPLLAACLLLRVSFRVMLLTSQSGLRSLDLRAHGVPVYPKVLSHSSTPLSRRTATQERTLFAVALQAFVERSAPRRASLPPSSFILKPLPWSLAWLSLLYTSMQSPYLDRRKSPDPSASTDDRRPATPQPVRADPGDVCPGRAPTGRPLPHIP